MLKYGGTLTLNNLIVYIAFNTDKVTLGTCLWCRGVGHLWPSVPTHQLADRDSTFDDRRGGFSGTVQAPK